MKIEIVKRGCLKNMELFYRAVVQNQTVDLHFKFFPTLILITVQKLHSKSLQSCLTLCDAMGHNLPGSSLHGILQA